MNYFAKKINELRAVISNQKFAEAKMVDGTLVRSEGDVFKPEQKLEVITEDGKTAKAPEGMHELEDGTVLVVNAEGVITEVREVKAEDLKDEAKTEDVKVEDKKDEQMAEEVPAQDAVEAVVEEVVDAVAEKIAELEKRIAALEGSNKEVETEMKKIEDENKNLKAELDAPAVKPSNFTKFRVTEAPADKNTKRDSNFFSKMIRDSK